MSISCLEVINGPDAGTQFRLLGGRAVIGRAEECEIRLPSVRGISRHHAEVIVNPDGIVLRDLQSQTGTFLDGKKIDQAMLPVGGVVKIGPLQLCLKQEEIQQIASPATPSSQAPAVSQETALPAMEEQTVAGQQDVLLSDENMPEPSLKGGAWILLIALLIGGGLYLLSAIVGMNRRKVEPFMVLQIRDERVVNLGSMVGEPKVQGQTEEGTPVITIRPYDGLLKDMIDKMNKRNAKVGGLRRNFLIVTGQAQGDVALLSPKKNADGQSLSPLMYIYVRGHAPYQFPEDLSPLQALELADQYFREAKILRQDRQLYAALKSLELSFQLEKNYGAYRQDTYRWNTGDSTNRDAGDGASPYGNEDVGRANQARFELTQVKNELRKRLEDLYEHAMHAAFPDKSGLQKRSYRRAYAYIQEAKRLVPDEESTDWQML